MDRTYDVFARSVTLWFNKWGDHDHNGLMFALSENRDRIEEFLNNAAKNQPDEDRIRHSHYELIRPLVLRACVGDTVKINFKNEIQGRHTGIHLVGGGYNVVSSDGAHVGINQNTLAGPGETRHYEWKCEHEGVFVFHDAGNLSGMEDGTNLHGLFGALIVEPLGTEWRDPVTGIYAGEREKGDDARSHQWPGDGLYVDIVPNEARHTPNNEKTKWLDKPVKYPEGKPGSEPLEKRKCFREFVIFFHDEVEFVPSHGQHALDPCHGKADACGNLAPAEHPTHPLMTISYRAEPMVARQQELWRRLVNRWCRDVVVAPADGIR